MNGAANKMQAQIATVKLKVVATQNNTQTLQSRALSLEGTQADLNLKTADIESHVETTQGHIVG
ncbi:hypothetical protein DPMN_192122 [Dreissena polymorpha]|uniref:Uncharacterized protein n=1 Tax=Dreissena polymorpha TaxID=45954 RepID=A0A9D3XYV2_DREPO|nr:hypothetical protein DPMN_192122 [Dreissena polymorpha]